MKKHNLTLEVSLGGGNTFDAMGDTYRSEGLSVGSNALRLFGQELQMEVCYEDLEIGKRIGHGACSSVNIAQCRETGVKYAVKMFNVYDNAQARQLHNEILHLAQVECDALVAFKGAFHHEGHIGVILEYMDRGSLEFLLDESIELDEFVMAAIAYQILWGLGYLHYDKKLHRDVKPANILMSSSGQVKLSDFGISKSLDSTTAMSNTAIGTFRYMSPERLLGKRYDSSGDIWSLGILLVQLWEKHYPFEDCSATPIELISELESVNFRNLISKKKYPRLMRDFILSMLEMNPGDRPPTIDLSESEWLRECDITSITAAQETVRNWLRKLDRERTPTRRKPRDARSSAPFTTGASPTTMKERRVANKRTDGEEPELSSPYEEENFEDYDQGGDSKGLRRADEDRRQWYDEDRDDMYPSPTGSHSQKYNNRK